jgi:hypothetical protein
MFRKDSVIQVGGYRNFYEGAEDYDLWSRLIGVGTMKNSSNVLTKYRIHSGQVTRSNTNKSQIAFEAALLSYRLRILGRPELDQIYESQIEWYAKDEIKRRRLNLKRFPIVALMKDQSDTLRDRSEFVHQLSTIQKISRIARLLARHPISGTRRLYRQLRYRAEYMLLEIRKEIEEMRSDSKSKDSRKYFLALGLLGIFNPHEFAFRSKYKVREWEARKLHFANRKLSSFRTGIKGKKSFKYVIYVMLFVLIHPGLAMSKIRLASKRDNR